jgi:hypothetical protein
MDVDVTRRGRAMAPELAERFPHDFQKTHLKISKLSTVRKLVLGIEIEKGCASDLGSP